uniref:Meiotic nuclear divisions 1 n=2 Tax=Monodelphis domestica TaxID=13616 RepID=A0A5F8G9Q5_MONDO
MGKGGQGCPPPLYSRVPPGVAASPVTGPPPQPWGRRRRQNQTRVSFPTGPASLRLLHSPPHQLGNTAARVMSKKKGLSAEEKRTRMMEIFFETKDVFQLKDMEKIAPKEKGITAMSVKEVLQSLVDDGMVDSERIGTSNYFWAFPSKALHAKKRKLETLSAQFSEGNQKKENLQQSINQAKIGRQDTEERTVLSKELTSLRQRKEQLKAELEKYKECDPDVVEEIHNIFAIKSWAKKKFGFEESKIDKNFGIPEDFDYID